MASFHYLCLFFIVFSVSYMSFAAHAKPPSILFTVQKDDTTLQYYTSIDIAGAPQGSVDVVIDLGGQFLWFNCDEGYNSESYQPIPCGSDKCKAAKNSGCTNNTCSVFPYNSISNLVMAEGLGEDTISVYTTDGAVYMAHVDVPNFPFSCVGSNLLQGLAKGTKGMVGLGRTQISLATNLALAFNLPQKFALCIPSSPKSGSGHMIIGERLYLPKSLVTVPLIINPISSVEYFIDVKSIKIDGEVVPFDTSLLSIDKKGVGGTKFNTIAPYTILQTSIYKAIVQVLVEKAASRKITQVVSVAPFSTCFNSNTIASTRTGPAVPTIDLMLQGQNVYWRIHGANSMVKVKKDVLCLGFIDGGLKPRTSIVVGGHQMADNLVEFDLASSKLGFSSSLLLQNTSCSQYRVF